MQFWSLGGQQPDLVIRDRLSRMTEATPHLRGVVIDGSLISTFGFSAHAMLHDDLVTAIDLALQGDWAAAHAIVQRDEIDRFACWVHAVLHKIEGDAPNARYWYGLAGQFYESFADPKAELATIKAALTY